MKALIAIASLLLLSLPLSAELTESHKAAIEQLLEVSNVEQQMAQSMKAGMEARMGSYSDQLIKKLPAERQERMKRGMDRIKEETSKSLNWQAMKPSIVEIYSRHFTEQEAKDVTALMTTPAGKMMVSKQIEMILDMMTVTQERMKSLTPMIMKIFKEEMNR
jgi:uncharacterized protein